MCSIVNLKAEDCFRYHSSDSWMVYVTDKLGYIVQHFIYLKRIL